jgi:hypothetical protein
MIVTPDIVTPDPIIQRSGRLPTYFIAAALSTKVLTLTMVVLPRRLGPMMLTRSRSRTPKAGIGEHAHLAVFAENLK